VNFQAFYPVFSNFICVQSKILLPHCRSYYRAIAVTWFQSEAQVMKATTIHIIVVIYALYRFLSTYSVPLSTGLISATRSMIVWWNYILFLFWHFIIYFRAVAWLQNSLYSILSKDDLLIRGTLHSLLGSSTISTLLQNTQAKRLRMLLVFPTHLLIDWSNCDDFRLIYSLINFWKRKIILWT
jgi:hypothetical protein